jgi:hypothetical protein
VHVCGGEGGVSGRLCMYAYAYVCLCVLVHACVRAHTYPCACAWVTLQSSTAKNCLTRSKICVHGRLPGLYHGAKSKLPTHPSTAKDVMWGDGGGREGSMSTVNVAPCRQNTHMTMSIFRGDLTQCAPFHPSLSTTPPTPCIAS